MKRALQMLSCVALVLGAATAAQAQSTVWPSKPLTLVVPFPPGGTSDVMGRMVAKELEKALGQPVQVENLPGGGGIVGTQKALERPADGYTLIQTGIGQSAVAHALNPALSYDSTRDFMHLTQVHEGANVMVVKPDGPYQNVKALVDASKSGSGVTYGYTPAASGHMAMELLVQMLNVCIRGDKGERLCKGGQFKGTSFSGGKPLIEAVAKGDVAASFINVDAAMPYIKDGRLKAIAISSGARSKLLPDVPTMSEAGYFGFNAVSWSGLSVAKGTPAPAAARLEKELIKIMNSPAVRQRMEADGFTVPTLGSAAYASYIAKETTLWTRVVRFAGIKM